MSARRATGIAPAAKSSPGDDKRRAKRLRLGTGREAWLGSMRVQTALIREAAAMKLEARGKALATDRRRVWAGRAPLEPGDYGAPGLIAREERTGRVFNAGESVRFDELNAGKTRVVWDPRKKLHTFVRAVEQPEHTERRGGTLPDQARWHFARARNKRELFERVEKCGEEEAARITVVCRDCKAEHQIPVGCGSQWFCPTCRKRAMLRLQKSFLRSRQGLLIAAARAGLTREDTHEKQERDRHWGRKRKPRRPPLGGFWGERFLTLTLPHRGGPAERIEVLNATWARFWRTVGDDLRPKLGARSGIRGEHLPRGISEAKAKVALHAKRYYRKAATHRAHAPTLERLETEDTGDFELRLYDLVSYFRVIEWTPGDDGLGHPHVHVWLFSQYLDQAWLERHWRDAWAHVQRARLHGLEEPKHGPIEQGRTVVHVEAAKEGIERELVKYLTKDWEVADDGGAKRVAPEVFAEVYKTLDGKRRRQSNSGFSMWAVEQLNACPDCGFECARNRWNRVDITHALDSVEYKIGAAESEGMFCSRVDETLDALGDPGRTRTPLTAADCDMRERFEREREAHWQASLELTILRARVQKHLSAVGAEPPAPVAAVDVQEMQQELDFDGHWLV